LEVTSYVSNGRALHDSIVYLRSLECEFAVFIGDGPIVQNINKLQKLILHNPGRMLRMICGKNNDIQAESDENYILLDRKIQHKNALLNDNINDNDGYADEVNILFIFFFIFCMLYIYF